MTKDKKLCTIVKFVNTPQLKSFKFIPVNSLQLLFHENRYRMGLLNKTLMASTVLAGLSSVAWHRIAYIRIDRDNSIGIHDV